jgi:hypothetical protein
MLNNYYDIWKFAERAKSFKIILIYIHVVFPVILIFCFMKSGTASLGFVRLRNIAF